METLTLTVDDLASISESGTVLKTLKASAIPAGLYSVVDVINFSLQTREEIISSLESNGKDTSWCSGLPDQNIKGTVRLEKGEASNSYYLNNALFNLMVEQGVFDIKDVKKNNKVVERQFELSGNQLKIS